MAKQKRFIPSKAQMNKYKSFLNERRKISRAIKKGKQLGERSMIGVPENDARIIPDMVLPKEMRTRTSFESKDSFFKTMQTLKQFKNEEFYFKQNYKNRILELLENSISDTALQVTGQELLPEAKGGFYSEKQKKKKEFSAFVEYMDYYNMVRRMNTSRFMEMYFKGYIKPFRYIYAEITVYGNRGATGKNKFLDEQIDMIQAFYQMSKNR